MAFIPTDAYLRENRKTRPYHTRREKSLPKPKYTFCPRRCTQRRTADNRLAEKKTYNLTRNKCENCGFSKVSMEKPLIKKASQL